MDFCRRSLSITLFVVSFALVVTSGARIVKGGHGTSHPRKANKNRDLTVMDAINLANEMSDSVGYQGDIVLTDRDENIEGGTSRVRRSSVRQKRKLWPHRLIPYEIGAGLENYKRNINSAIHEFEKHTCLKFTKRTTEKNWVKFNKGRGCWSYIGRIYWRKGGQELSLGQRCNSKRIVMHEMMHAVGFWHEQSRPDRDDYVDIIWDNIRDGMANQFNKYKQSKIDNMNFTYDYASLMHYGSRTFSKNGKATLRAKNRPYQLLGRRSGFSSVDIKKMNALYDCENKDSPGWSGWSSFSSCSNHCVKYRQRICFSMDKTKCRGMDAHGVQRQRIKCSEDECRSATNRQGKHLHTSLSVPIDGQWSPWTAWTACTKRCGGGTQQRTRTCDNPAPKFGGKPCESAAKEERVCNLQRCPNALDTCTFDKGYCFWVNTHGSTPRFTWRRGDMGTPSRNTGPTRDHTTGLGHYLYLETSYPARRGYKAHLRSKTFVATEGRCLSWWYNMNGYSIGALNVYKAKGHHKELVWTRSRHQGKAWLHGSVLITSKTKFQILFEGVRGAGYTGDIAIDDVRFGDGPCKDGANIIPA